MISKSQLKYIKSLQNKKQRDLENCFIAEGIKTVLEIISEKPHIIKELYSTELFYKNNKSLINAANIKHTLITNNELEQISLLSTPNDALAVCNTIINPKIEFNFTKNHAFYLDNIRDPGNLGTIIRICSWFGISDLFCSPNTVEVYNPKCIQASMGAFLKVNVHYISLDELLNETKLNTIYATTLSGKNIYQEKLKPGIIIIGNEANGISDTSKKQATHFLTIPSANNKTESLNAAIACSIIASEFYRSNLV